MLAARLLDYSEAGKAGHVKSTRSHAFGALLRGYRVAIGLTQEELAERAGLSVRGISDLERGVNRAPYVATILRLVDALALSDEQRAELESSFSRRRGPTGDPLVAQPGWAHLVRLFTWPVPPRTAGT